MKTTTFCWDFLSDNANIYLFRDGMPMYCGSLANCPYFYLARSKIVCLEWLDEEKTMRICVESDN